MSNDAQFRFSFGPWNIHEGADVFGPATRESFSFAEKLASFRSLGFEGVQFHDDDAVPDLEDLSPAQIRAKAKDMRNLLTDHGLSPEFVAPRLWEHPRGADGGYTANRADVRQWAIERSKRCIDIAQEMGTDLIVLWLAREGTYIREAKDTVVATQQLLEAVNTMLEYDSSIRICIEPKPNEPADHTFIPTMGHGIALAYQTVAPERFGVLMESAHAVLAGLDPSDEISFAMHCNKLFSVHLNDQNGLKFDQDKSFGSVNLRRAFNQVYVMVKNGYGTNGEYIGIDVKAMRTQSRDTSFSHLDNSRRMVLALADVVSQVDEKLVEQFRQSNDYEALDMYINGLLMGRSLDAYAPNADAGAALAAH